MIKISSLQYAQTLLELTDGKSEAEIDLIILRFIDVIRKNNHWKHKNSIIDQFTVMYNKKNSIIDVYVESARELSDLQQESIRSFVKKKYNAKQVNVSNEIDKDLIGGLIIRINEEVIDVSISNKINQIKRYLMQ